MPTNVNGPRYVYGIASNYEQLTPLSIVSPRAPSSRDRAEIGTMWLDQTLDDVYVLTKVSGGTSTWMNVGGGSGTFNALNVTTTAVIGTGLTVSAGTLTLGAMSTRGVLTNTAAGVVTSNVMTNGQVLIGSTGVAPVVGTLTAGAGIGIVNGAGTITISAPGATAVQYTEDDTNIIVPDGLGNVNVVGVVGGNITTVGAVANTIGIDTVANPTFAGLVTCQAGITQSAGVATIESATNAANAIYLHTNGGTNETIQLFNEQGTDAASIGLYSGDGGITLAALSLASNDAINIVATAGGVDIDSAMLMSLQSTLNANAAMTLVATQGGIDITASGADANDNVDIQATRAVTVTSLLDAAACIYLHANGGTSETIRLHSAQGTGVASINIDSDLGGITLDSGLASADAINLVASVGGIDVDAALLIDIQSTRDNNAAIVMTATQGGIDLSAQGVDAGDDISMASARQITANTTGNVAQSIYLHTNGGVLETIEGYVQQGTDPASIYLHSTVGGVTVTSGLASADAINIGATNAAGGIDIDAGTNGINVAAANGPIAILSGTGQIDVSADAAATAVNIGTGGAVKTVTLGSGNTASQTIVACGTAGLTLGTTANEHTTTIGSTTTASSVVCQSGTGNAEFGANATDHTTLLGSVTGVSATTLRAGTGAVTVTAGGAFDVNATGSVTIDSTGGTIGIGSGADAQNINIGIGAAARTITVGNITTTTGVAVNSGTGGITLNSNSTGNIRLTPATNSAAGTAVTLDSKIGIVTLTGNTTAAGAQETFTITNSEVSATSGILVTVANVGANDARMTLEQVKPAAGSFEVKTQNNGGADLNGNCIISFIVLS